MPLADFTSDQRQIQTDWPSLLEFDGRRINCTSSEVREEVLIDDRGDYDPTSKDVIAVLSDFHGTIPDTRATVKLDEVQYYIFDKESDEKTDTIRFTLKRI